VTERRRAGRPSGRGAGVLVAALVVVGLLPATVFAPTAGAQSHAPDTVTMTVQSVSPSTPTPSTKLAPLTVQLQLTNTGSTPLQHVRIDAERGDPIGNQQALDKLLADPTPPSTPGFPIAATRPRTVDLPPGVPTTTTFTTSVSLLTSPGLCICHEHAVYPLFFSAHVVGAGGVDQRLGAVATYLPAFDKVPAPVRVSWVWPLIDRPHRLTDDTVFTDDTLADSVQPGGRLSRALDVVESVGSEVPLTLVVDPELLDELAVMATGKYIVETDGHRSAGTGASVAQAWLDRFRAVLDTDPQVQVELTPYADPDLESLEQHDLSWTSTLPPAMQNRVATVLAGRSLDSTVAWPPSGAVSTSTLRTLADDGVGTVLLDSSAVTPRSDASGEPAGLARLSSGNTDIAAVLTDPAVEKYAAAAIGYQQPGDEAARPLPQLVAELAIRAAQEPDTEHVGVITAPRYVDPDPAAAAAVIRATSSSTFARPIALRQAVGGALLPVGRSKLTRVPASATALPDSQLDAATLVTSSLPALRSLLDWHTDAAARALLDALPIGTQRVESAAWRIQRIDGGQLADQLSKQIGDITMGVHIVRPSSGSYTLASNNSPLPITVENTLPYAVHVRLQVTTVVNAPGFTATDVGVQGVDSNQKRTLNLPTSVQRSGRFQVQAQLLTPNGATLGAPVALTVHSTALGVVGVVITVVAGVVLALALLVRLAGRWRKRRRGPAPARDVATPEPVR
jgi:hypothetical protein